MAKRLMMLAVAAAAAFGAWSATETVDGITWTYSVSNGKAKIDGIPNTTAGAITIPSSLGGCSVASIGSSAFFGCTSLTKVTIPDGVVSIGSSAFYGCSGLVSVTVPNSVTSLGGSVFCGCTALTKMTIPDGATSIGASSFSGCNGLVSVTIGKSVTSIGSSAFSGCSALLSATLPDGVISIGSSAFSGCSALSSIVIPDDVVIIGDYAFSGCSRLVSISIPDGITSIGRSTFQGCDSLASVTIPDDVSSIGEYAFNDCNKLESVTIGKSMTSIGSYAFYSCGSLTSITIPGNVESIANNAFAWCRELRVANLPRRFEGNLDDSVFYYCADDFHIVYYDDACNVIFNANGGIGGVTRTVARGTAVGALPTPTRSGYDFVGWFTAAAGGVQVTASTIINANVTYYAQWVKSSAGGGDPSFVYSAMVGGVTWSYTVANGEASLGGGSSSYPAVPASTVGAFAIPSSLGGYPVTSIGDEAFYGCSKLTRVTIPDSVTNIGYCAFSGCSSLESVVIPETVRHIGVGAFWETPYDAAIHSRMSKILAGSSEPLPATGEGYSLAGVSRAAEDRTIASVKVYGDCFIDNFVLKDGKVYDSVLRIVNKADHEVYLVPPAGYVYETIGNDTPLTLPASSTSLLTITRTDDKTFLVTRQTLNVIH